MAMQYPCDIFFMREDKTADALYLLEDERQEQIVLAASSKNKYRIDKCEVKSFEDVLNVRHLPGFVCYVPAEMDSFVEEHLTKECL